jgi:PAS domain S-box-containing protein
VKREAAVDCLRILHLEDDPDDAELVRRTLDREGIPSRIERVITRRDFVTALDDGPIDLVLSDFSLPTFDGMAALALVRERGADIPFILVSGTLGEETAIDSLRNGATDYVLKSRLSRLAPAVTRAIKEAEERERRRRSEASLGESEARFRTLFEEMPVGMAMFTEELVITEVNRAHCRMGGWERGELIGRNYRELLHPDDGRTFRDRLHELFRGERQCWEFEQRYLGAKDTTVWGAVTASLSRFEAGQRVLGLAVVQDRSEPKQLEEQLRQAQKLEALGRLAGGVAHDFNNLLSVIMGYADVAMQKLGAEHPIHGSVEEVRKAGERATALTRQLLAFSRKQILKLEIVDLNVVVVGMDRMLRRVIGEDIELTTRLTPDLDRVECDPGQIEQILMNLVVNARDAMPTGGRLILETANVFVDERYVAANPDCRPGPHVALTITDNGHGMDAATRSRIFEPFFTTKPAGKGTGLGLSTVYGIVKQSGGDIWVYSEPGRGTTFKVYLPRVSRSTLPAPPPTDRPELPRGTETVLLVEDDRAVRDLLRLMLEGAGYSVLHTGDVDDAIARCRNHAGTIHLLLTDVVMPKMSGPQLADAVSALRPGLKVLYMSGYTDEAILHHGVVDPALEFLEKPIRKSVLLDRVRSTLDG